MRADSDDCRHFDALADSLENYMRLLDAGVLYKKTGPVDPENIRKLRKFVKKLRNHDTSVLYED